MLREDTGLMDQRLKVLLLTTEAVARGSANLAQSLGSIPGEDKKEQMIPI